MKNSQQVAFLGLGTMGGSMALSLLEAGFSVRAYNRGQSNRDALLSRASAEAEKRLQLCASASEAVVGAFAVVCCLSDDEALKTLALGEEGFVSKMAPGALWIDTGTTSLELTSELAELATARGVEFLDAPMTGSMLGAQRGTLTFMVGGPASRLKRAKGMLDAMGGYTVHVGPTVGAGQSAKCCLNMTQSVVLQGILEGYALAQKLGVSLEKMSDILEHSAGKTGVGSFKTPYLKERDFRPHFRLDLMQKDLHLALDRASKERLALPCAQSVRVVYDQGVAEGWGAEDFLVLARLLERWGGFTYQ